MLELIQKHVTEILAILALLASVGANVIAERARRAAVRSEARNEALSRAERRIEALVELELKNAAVGSMLFLTARKLLLLYEHPELEAKYAQEVERLSHNLDLLQQMREKQELQRQLTEQATMEGNNIALQAQALADVKRLRVSLESEAAKESEMLDALLQEIARERA